ncbi:hypothetical protein Bbelb_192650, partial [Branchiostoma belcheri]
AVDECYDIDGASNYRGTVDFSKSGRACQRWDSQTPHSHTVNNDYYPDDDLVENYCRHPNGDTYLWCYTQDPSQRYEECAIPRCVYPTLCMYGDGSTYHGTVHTTQSGLTCQRWDSQSPHEHNTTVTYPLAGLYENYCRNPDGASRPWCYTTNPDVTREYCDISTCFVDECYEGDGASYRGTVSFTKSGRACQYWARETPHTHGSPVLYPSAGLVENYCRNPDDNEWTRYGTNYFRVYDEESKTYADAKAVCAGESALLPIVKDSGTRDFLVNLRNSSGSSFNIWIGVTDLEEEGEFVWDDGSPPGWEPVPSSNSESWDCAKLTSNDDDPPNQLVSVNCNDTEYYICERITRPCSPNPCINNGTCVETVPSGFLCRCGENYSGTYCGAINGGWSAWSVWAECSVSCGTGTGSQARTRHCDNPEPQFGGNNCTGDAQETKPCNADVLCSVNKTGGSVGADHLLYPTLCMYGDGSTYRGTVNITQSGLTCQRWDSQSPHVHNAITTYPLAGLNENYCRNPDGSSRPWCYTTDPDVTRDFCKVSSCFAVDECYDIDGASNYRGTVDFSKSGRACQRWDSQTPHSHTVNNDYYPDDDLVENYCRHPNGDTYLWCYTQDPSQRYEECAIPRCVYPTLCMYGNGSTYRGTVNTTQSGLTCQRWDSQSPHVHNTTVSYPLAGLHENYCRNPDGASRPWCYTTNPDVTREYCDISTCFVDECYEGDGASYRGTVSFTKSGRACQYWARETPHTHGSPGLYPSAGLVENYCRNPDDNEWTRYGTNYFRVYDDESKTYADAKAVCAGESALLPIVKDSGTRDFLVNLRDSSGSVTDLEEEGEFVWDDGSPPGWEPVPSSNGESWDCAKLTSNDDDPPNQLVSVNCNDTEYYICERITRPCSPNPCINNGTCVETVPSGFLCRCGENVNGTYCGAFFYSLDVFLLSSVGVECSDSNKCNIINCSIASNIYSSDSSSNIYFDCQCVYRSSNTESELDSHKCAYHSSNTKSDKCVYHSSNTKSDKCVYHSSNTKSDKCVYHSSNTESELDSHKCAYHSSNIYFDCQCVYRSSNTNSDKCVYHSSSNTESELDSHKCAYHSINSGNDEFHLNFNDSVWYSQAKQVCRDNGGNLAMITNSEISSFMKTLSTDHKWFGLSDEGTEGQFVWEDGTRLTSTGFTDWYPGEPNGGGSEDCVQYWRHSWNDRSCTDQLGFTCEVQATTLTLPPPTTLITDTIYPVRFTVVVGIPWNEEYRNPASMAYQELVNDTTQSVSKAFAANAAFHSVIVHDISPGSVVVIFSVQFIGARPNETAVHATMASAVAESLLVVAGHTVSQLSLGGAEGGLCSGVACANHSICEISPEGELQCTCRNGYSGDGTVVCRDIDECSNGSHTCSRDELCFNTEGSYRCAQCYPDFTVQGGAETPASAVTILLSFAWTVWSVEGSDIKLLNTTGKLRTSAHEVAVPKNFLPLGLNMLKVMVTVLEKESGHTLNRTLDRWVRIISSPIEARIAGGSARSVRFGSAITLDASVSYDPDNIVKDSRLFNFSWTCMIEEASTCNEVFNVSTEAVYVIPSGIFRPNDSITFTVDVSFSGRVSGVYAQAVYLGAEDPTISVRCNSNCNNRINPSKRLALQAVCENCLQHEQLVYNWTLQQAPPGYRRSIFNWETDTTTGNYLPDLVVQTNIFTKPGAYVLRVDVRRAGGVSGFAEYRFEPNTPPTAGVCTVSPETGVAMVDEFSVQCTGFADSDLPMTFAFFYSTGGQRLVAINSTAEDDDLSLFYSALVPSTPPRLFPVGLPSRDYNVTIVVRASDVLGAQASVSLVVKVFPLPAEEKSSVATQLTIGANSTLGKLVQGGNFQAAVQISNSVNSVLNADAENATNRLQYKQNATQVRSSIISSLSEFKVQSVSSVNLLANALSQATVVQEEVSTDSQVTAAASLVNLVEVIQNQPEDELGIEEAEESSVFLTSALVNVLRASSYSSEEAKSSLTGSTKTDRLQQTQVTTIKVFKALNTMNDVVLGRKRPNEKPTLLQQDNFELSLRKQTCDQMGSQIVATTEANGGWFRTPNASILFGDNTCSKPIGSETYQTTINPYEYAGDSDRIQSSVGALKYKNDVGELTVSNLEIPVEVVVKRKDTVQVQTERGRTGRTGTSVMSIHSFNVTEEENSIHVIVTPDLNWVPIQLYLWRHDEPIKGQHGWNVTLPLSSDQLYSVRWLDGEDITADPYSWFWTPEELATGEGQMYFLGVEHIPFNRSGFDLSDLRDLENGTSEVEFSYNDENFTLPYTVTILSTRCLFFHDQSHRWKSDGCRSGPLTSDRITHCFCDHLTAFGSDFQFFVAPNSLNILEALQGFNNISENPAVVVTIAVIVGIYFLMVLWARREDRKDVEKVGATVLGSSPGDGCSVYQVVVFTGARANAGTTAKVSAMFYGSNGESGPHELDDPGRVTFCTGGVDFFLVTYADGMGPLDYIHIWHDNSGDDPSWFLSKIIVTEVKTDNKYYFLCNKWFAVEEGDGKVERIFPVASDMEMKRFKTIFSSKTGTGFRDDHLWFSVLGRPAYSMFSRVQRVSCCLSLLLCTMLANIMFFGTADTFQKPPAVNIFGFDVQLPISWGEIMIAVESALLVFPVNLAIVQIFRHCGARPAQLKETDQHRRTAKSKEPGTSEGQSSSMNSSTVSLMKEFTEDDQDLIREILTSHRAPTQLKSRPSMKENPPSLKGLRSGDGSYDVKRADSAKTKKTKKSLLLPWWCVYIVNMVDLVVGRVDQGGGPSYPNLRWAELVMVRVVLIPIFGQ